MEKVLVVGGSSGFGLVLSEVLASRYLVTTTGRSSFRIPGVNCVPLDSASLDVEWILSVKPRIIVNNGYDKRDHIGSFRNSLSVIRESMKYFKENGGGTILNVNSIAGLQPDTKDPYYAASKHGLKGFVKSISYEAYLNNIKIINLYPRAIAVGMSEGRLDCSELIDPRELADFCATLLNTDSFYASSIVFDRAISASHKPDGLVGQ